MIVKRCNGADAYRFNKNNQCFSVDIKKLQVLESCDANRLMQRASECGEMTMACIVMRVVWSIRLAVAVEVST